MRRMWAGAVCANVWGPSRGVGCLETRGDGCSLLGSYQQRSRLIGARYVGDKHFAGELRVGFWVETRVALQWRLR